MKSSDARNTIHDGPLFFFGDHRFKLLNITNKILTRLTLNLRRVLNDRLGNITASQKLEGEKKPGNTTQLA